MANIDLVDHLVVVVLENRSFDHMLGYLSLSGRNDVDGLLDTPAFRDRYANKPPAGGKPYYSTPLTPDLLPFDPPHTRKPINQQMDLGPDGVPRMTGFVKALGSASPAERNAVMTYQLPDVVWTYDYIAANYAISDRWFSSVPASTQPNRLMFMCGQTTRDEQALQLPVLPTVYEWLNEHKVEWRTYYRGNWPFVIIMPHPNFGRRLVHDPQLNEFSAAWNDPACPSVIFIEPRYYFGPLQSKPECDHPYTRASVTPGQRLIYEVLRVVASNQSRWRKTMVLVTYDEHGGLFDHVAPPRFVTPCGENPPFAFLGIRVPALVVSPFTPRRTVLGSGSGHVFDHTSILRFLGDRWGEGHYNEWVDARNVSSLGEFVMNVPTPDSKLILPDDRKDPPVADASKDDSAIPEEALPIAEYLRQRVAQEGLSAVQSDFPELAHILPYLVTAQ